MHTSIEVLMNYDLISDVSIKGFLLRDQSTYPLSIKRMIFSTKMKKQQQRQQQQPILLSLSYQTIQFKTQ